MLFRKLKLLQSPMERAAADAELFCCFGSVSGALIQSSRDEPNLVFADINQVLAWRVAMRKKSRSSAHCNRQIPDGDLFPCRKRHARIDSSLQFSDVSRPIVPQQAIHSFP